MQGLAQRRMQELVARNRAEQVVAALPDRKQAVSGPLALLANVLLCEKHVFVRDRAKAHQA